MRPRRGFAAIVLVFSAAVLLFIWAGSQHFVTSTVRRRVRIAESERAATLIATSSAEQLVVYVPALLTLRVMPAVPTGLPADTLRRAETVGEALGRWTPDAPLDMEIDMPWMQTSMKHVPIRLLSGRLRATMTRVDGGPDAPFSPATDCPRYGAWKAANWAGADASDPAFQAARRRQFPGWSPLRVQALGVFEGKAEAVGLGLVMTATTSLLRQIDMTSSPCPAEDPDDTSFQFKVNPIGLGRTVRVARKNRRRGGGTS